MFLLESQKRKRNNGSLLIILSILLSIFLLGPSAMAEEATTPELSIIATPQSGAAPLSIQFSLTSSSPLSTYSWDFDGDGSEDSTESEPTFTFPEEGKYLVQVNTTTMEGTPQIATTTISVLAPISISLTALPSSGVAPLTVQFTAIATGKQPLSYAWDFTGDGMPDSTQQNPVFTYEPAGTFTAMVTVTDGQGQKGSKSFSITTQAFESKLNISSYFPTTLVKGENQVTFLLSNTGESTLRDLTAKVVGKGLQHLSSGSIGSLKPGEDDSLTVKINVLDTGTLPASIKIADKSFPVQFTVAEEAVYNKDELLAQLTVMRQRFDEQERIYTTKKSEGYLVSEVFESMKVVKKQLLDVQQQLLTNKYAEAKINLDLAITSLDDIAKDLELSQKQKVTALSWLKENALAITAILAALGTLGGFMVKLKGHAQKVGEQAMKVGETMKERMKKKETKGDSEEQKEAQEKMKSDS